MSSSLYDAAVSRISAIRNELDELEQFVRQYKVIEAKLMPRRESEPEQSILHATPRLFTKVFGSEPANLHFRAVTNSPTATVNVTTRPTSKARILASAALKEIDLDGCPIQVSDLVPRIEAQGLTIGGENPAANLSAHLNNSDWLVSLKGYGWWPKEKPYPPANYPGESPEKDEAVAPHLQSDATASVSPTPNDAVKRGEVGHDNMTP
jgi:hypothetical protein